MSSQRRCCCGRRLVGFAPGDLLVLDVNLAATDSRDPAELRRADLALQRDVRPSHVEWLGGPIMRYCNGATSVSLRYELETNCPVPGSYCLDTLATVKLSDGREKLFSAFRFKRYTPAALTNLLQNLGWECIQQFPYGESESATPIGTLLLYRKTAAPQPAAS